MFGPITHVFQGAIGAAGGVIKDQATAIVITVGSTIKSWFWWVKYVIPIIIVMILAVVVGVLHKLDIKLEGC